MNHTTRLTGLFLCFILLLVCTLPSSALAQDDIVIDVSYASDGYFSVYCSLSDSPKMKVGVTLNQQTVYYSYTVGETWNYAFERGNGDYVISLYSNVSGTQYKRIAYENVTVELDDEFAPFLVSTWEVGFSADDEVCQKACEICKDLPSNFSKTVTIYNYIYKQVSYDDELAADIQSGAITTYVPNAVEVLNRQKGICYDYAVLFAAMCRSQGIPCTIVKGYYRNAYHAWNKVYANNRWYEIDLVAGTHKQLT